MSARNLLFEDGRPRCFGWEGLLLMLSAILLCLRFSGASWLQGSGPGSGSWVPRFSHGFSRFSTFLVFFFGGRLLGRSTRAFSTVDGMRKAGRHIVFSTHLSNKSCTRRVSASGYLQMFELHHPACQISMVSADATQLKLPAGVRQPIRRLCTWIGCRSRPPVGPHQSKAMKGCALSG